jgi:hypothetical protein
VTATCENTSSSSTTNDDVSINNPIPSEEDFVPNTFNLPLDQENGAADDSIKGIEEEG